MRIDRFRTALVLSLGLLAAACGKQQEGAAPTADASSPTGTIVRSAQLLKQGDIAGLMQNALPPAEFQKVKANWGKDVDQKPITDEDRRKFQEAMERLTQPDAADKIYAEIEPQLKQFDEQYQKQMPMYVAMGSGWLQGIVQQNKNLSDAEKQQAIDAINAVSDWVSKTRFTDPASVKKVLAIVSDAAREIDLKTLDQARSLDFDESMKRAHVGFVALEKALAVYGFSVDQTLDSVKPEVVSNDGTNAKVRIDYTLLGKPLTATTEMVKVDGRWYGKQTIDKIHEEAQQTAPAKSGADEDGKAEPASDAHDAADTPPPGHS